MTALWRVHLLGELRSVRGEREVTRFRTHKTAALWATLACPPLKMHLRDQLLEQLWPDAAPADARNNLSVALSSLRNLFEPPGETAGSVIRADRQQVGLNPAAVTTDAADFELGLEQVERANNDSARIAALESALSYYAGPLLPGYYEDWFAEERRRLAERHLTAVRSLVRLLAQSQELGRALEWARRAVAADPLREESTRDLMRLLVATGQPSVALQQYRDLEARLRQELDAEPSASTRRMMAEIQARLQERAASPETVIQATAAVSPASTAPLTGPDRRNAATDPRAAPTGTVTFVLAQVTEGPDADAEADEALAERLRAQQEVLEPVWARHRGYICERSRDAWEVAFSNAHDALVAAIAGQSAMAARAAMGGVAAPSVRMALHTGDVTPDEGRYYSRTLMRAARLIQAGHGGQILCSEVTASLLRPDLEPGASLIDLGVYRLIGLTTPERIFQIAYPNQPTVSFAPLHAEYATASHLPLPVSRFFGRERELSRLLDLLALPQTRLVTLTGPGGTGKTRLALETARRLVDRYSGAVWFVPLGELVRDDLLTTAVSDAIGVARSAGQDPFTLVVTALAAQPCLLVLDNLEHLLAPAAVWLTDLLARVPTCTCLATSRERLNLDGELELPIATLPVPSVTKEVRRQEVGQQEGVDHPSALFSFPSVALFVDRCQTVQPEFHLTADNAEAVAALCAGLEGLPLAIELAAARAQVATPAQMVTMLSRRFDLLVSRRRDLSARHRTMRATIEWSYNLLAPELQQFFRRLSVFRGGWSLEAAETVCEEPLALDALAQLREGSLIITEEAAGEMRFGMMETLREYAQEQLGRDAERARTVQRHQEWCVALAEAAAPQLLGPQQRRFLEQLEREHDNIRAAFARCRESAEGVETDLRLVGSLWLFWYIRAHVREGRDQCATALARSGTDAFVKARASALNGAGNLCVGQDPAQARAYHEECLALRRELGDLRGVAGSLNNLGNAAVYSGDYPAARSYFEQALTINQTTGNRTLEAGNLHNLGEIAREEGNTEAATEYFKAALTINEETGNGAWKASNLNGLAHMAKLRGDLSGALTDHDAALSIYRSLGDRVSEAYTLFLLGGVAELAGDLEAARGHYERALAINRETGDANWERRNLDSLARIAAIESGKKSG